MEGLRGFRWLFPLQDHILGQILLGLVLGLAVSLAAVVTMNYSFKAGYALVGAAAFLLLVVRSRSSSPIFLFLLVFSIQVAITKSIGGYSRSHVAGAPGFYVTSVDLVLIALYLFALLDKARLRLLAKYLFSPTSVLYLGFLVAALLSMLAGDYLRLGLAELTRMVLLFALFYFFAFGLQNKREIKIVLAALLVTIVVQSIWGLAQFVFKRTFGLTFLSENADIWTEDFVNGTPVQRVSGSSRAGPNEYGSFMALFGSVAFGMALAEQRKPWRWFYILLGVGAMGCGALSLSRGGIIQMGASLSFIAFIVIRRGELKLKTLAGALLIIAIGASIPAYLYRDQLWARFFGATEPITNRLDMMKFTLGVIIEHPWLGTGLNTFQQVVPQFDKDGILPLSSDGTAYYPVHNFHLLLMSEIGLIGYAMFMLFTLNIFYQGWKAMHGPDPWFSWIATGIFCGLVAFLFIEEQGSFGMRLLQTGMYYAILMGLMVSARRLNPNLAGNQPGQYTQTVQIKPASAAPQR
ncbi:MAG: O-antigen ligase family protein [Chloroflexi bacterium]|nr:O-antigen ligase family protein [Chloroflexota bacterium]